MKAAEMALKQRKIADDFADTFPRKTVQQWRQMVEEWQTDPLRPNPYVSNKRGTFFLNLSGRLRLTAVSSASKLSEARLRLTQEEVTEAEQGQHAPHEVTASVFIRMGLELQDQQ